jgi:hypothetical protein
MRTPVALLLLATALAGCLGSSTPTGLGPLPVEDFPGLTPHAAMVEHLLALPAPVDVAWIGQSVEGRDLHVVTIGEGPFELWLAARHHGNEPTSTEAVLNTLDYLLGLRAPGPGAFPVTHQLHEHRALLLQRITFVIVPMVNPDGAEAYRRENANGQDLNRDYLLFAEPESRAVRDAFWRHWPDAGLDLHNEGLTPQYDYDAYYPEVPRAEDDTQVLSLANQWRVVREVEASGSYAGGPNENYVTDSMEDPCQYGRRYLPEPVPPYLPIPPPTGNTDPTAYCEGTHDAFLTLRGAPGWTPEAAIEWDTPTSATLPWGVRQHEATIASTAFHYAGIYDACLPRVQKFAGTLLGNPVGIPVATSVEGARFQLVWRDDPTGLDQPADELDLTLRTPTGGMVGPEARPGGYTETLHSPEAGAHVATVSGRGPAPTPYELRVHECLPLPAGLEVQRTPQGLVARNTGRVALLAEVQESILGAHALPVPGAAVRVVDGNLAPKTMLTWLFALDPGAERTLAYPLPTGAQAGPARWHAHAADGTLLLGVGTERGSPSPPPN